MCVRTRGHQDTRAAATVKQRVSSIKIYRYILHV